MALPNSRWWKWPVVLACLAGVGGAAYLVHREVQEERNKEESEKVETRNYLQGKVLKLGKELAQARGIEDKEAVAIDWKPRTQIYGRVVPHPRASGEIRAPFAGMLREDRERHWPNPGQAIREDKDRFLGWLDIRVGPQERLDLKTKLNGAQLKEAGARKIFEVKMELWKRLESASGSVSQAERDAARVQMIQAKTDLFTAEAAVKLWKEALEEIDRQGARKGTIWSWKLTAPVSGEVTELLARPGMAVEAGAPLVRIVDYSRVLIRLDIPVHLAAAGRLEENLEIFPVLPPGINGLAGISSGNPPGVRAKRLGPAPRVDVTSQFAGYWYEVEPAGSIRNKNGLVIWRPGLFVKAGLPDPAAATIKAFRVPASAILYHQGRTQVYRRTGPGEYEAREVRILDRDEDFLIVTDLQPHDRVVFRQAQILLAEEFRPGEEKAKD